MVVIMEWAGANTSGMETDTNIFQHMEQNMLFLSMRECKWISRVRERQKRMKDWGLGTTEWKALSIVLSYSQERNKEQDILYSRLRNPFPVPFIWVLLTPWQLQLWVAGWQYIEWIRVRSATCNGLLAYVQGHITNLQIRLTFRPNSSFHTASILL
jgi:hypothetical protein